MELFNLAYLDWSVKAEKVWRNSLRDPEHFQGLVILIILFVILAVHLVLRGLYFRWRPFPRLEPMYRLSNASPLFFYNEGNAKQVTEFLNSSCGRPTLFCLSRPGSNPEFRLGRQSIRLFFTLMS